jgi:uncharacterized protein YdcH (DUF465 family)
MNQAAAVRDRLAAEDPAFRRLVRKHKEFDDRLQELQARKFLTDEEKLEIVNIKKHKLALKDQMEEIVRQAS